MNTQEIKERLVLAKTQFGIRSARLQQLYEIDAPTELIESEIELLRKAGSEIKNYSLPYEALVNLVPQIEGELVLNEIMNKGMFDEVNENIERKWIMYRAKLISQYGQEELITEIIAHLKKNALFIGSI